MDFGTFNYAVITSLGNATAGTIPYSTGNTIKDTTTGAVSFFHNIIGGGGGEGGVDKRVPLLDGNFSFWCCTKFMSNL